MKRVARVFLRVTGLLVIACTTICCRRDWTWRGAQGEDVTCPNSSSSDIETCVDVKHQRVLVCVFDFVEDTISCVPAVHVSPEQP